MIYITADQAKQNTLEACDANYLEEQFGHGITAVLDIIFNEIEEQSNSGAREVVLCYYDLLESYRAENHQYGDRNRPAKQVFCAMQDFLYQSPRCFTSDIFYDTNKKPVSLKISW